jgi:hypothetical protein
MGKLFNIDSDKEHMFEYKHNAYLFNIICK